MTEQTTIDDDKVINERRDLIMHKTRQILERFYSGNMNYLSLQNKILSLRKIYKNPLSNHLIKKLEEIE